MAMQTSQSSNYLHVCWAIAHHVHTTQSYIDKWCGIMHMYPNYVRDINGGTNTAAEQHPQHLGCCRAANFTTNSALYCCNFAVRISAAGM